MRRELYHTDLGVRVRKLGESPQGKLIYVERIEDGHTFSIPAGELTLVILDEDGLTTNKRRGVGNMEKLKLDEITFERGTVVPNEIGNLTAPTGELTKILQDTCTKIVALGFKAPREWSGVGFGKNFSAPVQAGVHA